MSNILDVIGNTPLVKLQRIPKKGRVFVKMECQNAGHSVKDRIALQMVKDLKESGKLKADTVLVEPTSGNTGVGLAMVCAALGIKLILTMPSSMSNERKQLIAAYGAELVLTEPAQGVTGAVKKAEEIVAATPGAILVGQFENPSNPKAHLLGTGPELVQQCRNFDIKPKYFVAGSGTGGTMSGCGKVLKVSFPEIQTVLVEPKDSPLISTGKAGPHKIQGIGPNFIPKTLDKSVVDQIELADYQETVQMVRKLAKEEGILLGISSGAAINIAVKYAEEHDCDVLVISPDLGERYLSVEGLFQ